MFDRNEGTSGSARTNWLLGVQTLGCLLRVNSIQRDLRGTLHIKATVLAIRSAHHELKGRLYEVGLYQSGLIGHEGDEFEDVDNAYDEEGGKSDGALPF